MKNEDEIKYNCNIINLKLSHLILQIQVSEKYFDGNLLEEALIQFDWIKIPNSFYLKFFQNETEILIFYRISKIKKFDWFIIFCFQQNSHRTMNDNEKKWSKELDEISSNIQKELNSEDYIYYSEKETTKVFQKQTSPTVRWKSVTEMNFPAKKIMDTFVTEDINIKKKYDVDVAEKFDFKVRKKKKKKKNFSDFDFQKVEKDSRFNLTYAKYFTPSLISDRDFLYCSKTYENEKELYIICNKIEVDDGYKDPNETGCVRASIIYVLFHIEKISESKSKVTYFSQTEPGKFKFTNQLNLIDLFRWLDAKLGF